MHLTGTLFALVAFHGVLLTGVLWNRRWARQTPMRILAALSATVTILASDIVLVIAGITNRHPHLMGLAVPAWFLLAPTLYLHVRTFATEKATVRPHDAIHLVPAVIVMALMAPFFLLPAGQKLQLAQAAATLGADDVRQQIFLFGYSFQMVVYAVVSWRAVARYDRRMVSEHTHAAVNQLPWLRRLLMLFALYVILDCGIAVAYAVRAAPSPTLFAVTTLLALSGTVYALGYTLLMQPDLLSLGAPPTNGQKYEKSALDSPSRHKYAAELDSLMRHEHIYRTPDLRLTDVSTRMGISRHNLSQTVNQEFGLSFFDFVNRWRIAEVVDRLGNGDGGRMTVLAIAHDAGFNSSASFYRMFNRYVGTTPSTFMEHRGEQMLSVRPPAPG